MAAGFAALNELSDTVYDKLESLGSRLEIGLRRACQEARVPARVQRVGSMISVFFNDHPVRNFDDAQRSDTALFGKLFHALLAKGVYSASERVSNTCSLQRRIRRKTSTAPRKRLRPLSKRSLVEGQPFPKGMPRRED